MSATGRFYAMNMQDGQKLTDEQHFALGQPGLDRLGQVWNYVYFGDAREIGEVVADAGVASAYDVTEAAPVGSKVLKSTGTFAKTTRTNLPSVDLKLGAYGAITAGAGQGQSFRIVGVIDDDTAQIELLPDGGGWTTALTTGSDFQLFTPGDARTPNNANNYFRGVAQVDATAGQFGWVLQKGVGIVRVDGIATPAAKVLLKAGANEKLVAGDVLAAGEHQLGKLLIAVGGTTSTEYLRPAIIDIDNPTDGGYAPPMRPLGIGGTVVR